MRTIDSREYETMPWKNGGGVTHEVACSPNRDNFAWRLSVAEVSISGPFSKFEGMQRILTVIDGVGINLVSDNGTQPAKYKSPTSFSGSTTINGNLIDGPVRDFNLIFDPNKTNASVEILSGSGTVNFSTSSTAAIYVASGEFELGSLRAGTGSTIMGTPTARHFEFNTAGWAICVHLDES